MQKTPYVFPLIGGRKVEHLHANIEAIEISLSPEHVQQIEAVTSFDVGFPTNFIVGVWPLMSGTLDSPSCLGTR